MLALTRYEIGLVTVALVFVAFALIAALVVPRARPEFPGKYLGLFIGICAVLFLAQMSAVLALTELGHAEEETSEEAAPPEPEPTETTPTETTPTETTPTETTDTETTPTEPSGSEAVGKEIFLARCGSCHTLADAGTTQTVGPNLDAAQPPVDLVVDRVTNGQGIMPSFADSLSEEQIADVAAYVSAVAGS